jgi:hypothetical protein
MPKELICDGCKKAVEPGEVEFINMFRAERHLPCPDCNSTGCSFLWDPTLWQHRWTF